jgi:phosphomannomutase
MNSKHIVLFDMDGTLTPPRKEFDKKLFQPLRNLSEHAEIGIVTGSDMDYLSSQMKMLIKYSELRFKTHLLPCNGTKHYKPPISASDEYKLIHDMNMQRHLGENCFRQLMMILASAQETMCYNRIPLTGHFISYRGSMINWCPIGRNANHDQRQQFVELDKSVSPTIRKREIGKITHKVNLRCKNKVVVKLGGETSFDIYPEGWDKTYALKHFSDYTCWFVGDRCGEDGNDKEIYHELLKDRRAFATTGTHKTALIINKIIEEIKYDKEI